MSPRTGRPIQGTSKRDIKLQFRVCKEEMELLDKCAKGMDATKTEVLIHGIHLVEKELDERK